MSQYTDLLDPLAEAIGENINVAVIDTGIDPTHPWIGESLKESYTIDVHPQTELLHISQCEPEDVVGHGTAVAGQILRVAPSVNLISVRILGNDRLGTSESLAQALTWIASQNIQIVNLSLSTQRLGLALRLSQSMDALWALGIPCVCAQGPSRGHADFPSSFAASIAVGAEELPEHAIRYQAENSINFSAPGVNQHVAWTHQAFRAATGSSYAAPLITGWIARMLELDRTLQPYEIMSALKAKAIRQKSGWYVPLQQRPIEQPK